MALGTPFDRLELVVLVVVAGVFSVAQPFVLPPNPALSVFYLFAAGLVSLGIATALRALRLRFDPNRSPQQQIR